MKKIIFLFFIIFFCGSSSFGAHLKGGWIQYTYLGPGAAPNTSRYEITVRQYLACNSTGGQRDPDVYVGIFNAATNQYISTVTINLSRTDNPNKTTYSPCLSTKPTVCYLIDVYTREIELPNSTSGYTLTVQRCCRITGIANLATPTDDYGISYTTTIPGTINGVNYSINKSPVFAQKDTVIVCYNSPFILDFSATDADGDSLTYNFCAGLTGGFNNRLNPNDPQASRPNPPTSPPYTPVQYAGLYGGSSPMGPSVNIDQKTGIISGVAPSTTGDYVMSVCVNEFRNGILINTTKKEIHVAVANCSLTAATLKPSYITCNGTTLNFENESSSSNITSYLWDFGVPSLTTDISTDPTPSFDYLKSGKDSGTFTVKLKVTSVNGCEDSTTSLVKVYPGFVPGFMATGTCFLNQYTFTDTSKTKYGTLQTWRWDFGDSTTAWADTSHKKDSVWKYPIAQNAQVSLIVSNSVGCIDTVTRTLAVLDKPVLNLPFRDTLICSIDTLMLRVNINNGSVLWRAANGPNQARILNTSSSTPLVYPRDTTKYYVAVNDNGCANTDSVTVNVLQFITVNVGLDTNICLTDTFRINTVSDALNYQWTSSTGELVQNVKYPFVRPLVNTQYNVTANLGKCQAKDSMQVFVSPYPNASAGPDLTICYGTRVQLNATASGTLFSWSPAASLINANTLTPTAGPTRTTAYILSATNTTGCLKPKTDTIVVTVIPQIMANAGKDTIAVPEQLLQLNATGGLSYVWTPSSYLSDPAIANPVAKFDNKVDSIIYTVRVSNGSCYSDDQVKVRIFKTGPDILVPSGFTPNGDGKNDVIKPVIIGIVKLNYFSIYNRWGQLLFTTIEENKGWDGNFNGVTQPAGTYVYQAVGLDYLGNTVLRKGTVVLIR